MLAGALIGSTVACLTAPLTAEAAGPDRLTTSTVALPTATDDVAVNQITHVTWTALATSDQVARIAADGSVKLIPLRDRPIGVEVDSARDLVYVTTQGSREVYVLDGPTGDVLASHPLTAGHGFDTSVDESSGQLYVPTDAGVEVFTTTSYDYLIKRAGGDPRYPTGASEVEIDTTTGMAYVTRPLRDEVILLQKGALAKILFLPGVDIAGVAVDSSTGTAYVSDKSNGTILVIKAGRVDSAIVLPTGSQPGSLAVDSSTGSLYVADEATNSVHEVRGGGLVASYPVPAMPLQIVVDEVAHTAWVLTLWSGVSAIHDGAVSSVSIRCPHYLDVDDVRHTAYVSDFCDPAVHVIHQGP